MYCNCSNKNNYEIISLCDIKKFSDKNGPFNNKGWVQISIADILMLDCTKHTIEKIEKIYISISITNTKIIDTPISPTANSEGMTLTGKKLLVDGFICSKIVYTSLTKEQTVYSSNFTIPFCTYVVIEPNADPFNDKYCVRTCIEDVFLSLIDCKTIFQNVTLFLLAERTSFTCAVPQPPNEDCIIIKRIFKNNNIILNDVNDNAVLTIKFDELNNKIIVDSTNSITDPAGGAEYFKFILYQSDGTTVKKTAIIGGNQKGMNFSKELSNTDFQNDDIVTLKTTSKDKVVITNFPDVNTPRFILTKDEQSFKIGANGLYPHILSEINFGNTPFIATMNFNGTTKKISVVSSGTSSSRPKGAIYLVKLRDGTNNDTIKVNSLIAFNEEASKFAQALNDASFNFDDILEIQIKESNSISIKNFPTIGNTKTINPPAGTTIKEFIKITEGGLSSFIPTNIPTTPKLSNTILIKNIGTQNPGVGISFNTLDKILDISYFTTFSAGNDDYFTLKFIRKDGTITQNTLGRGGTGDVNVVSGIFSNLFFDYGDKLEFNFTGTGKSSITITNFPSQGKDYTPVNDKEIYEITHNGLLLIPSSKLPNDIVINKPDGSAFGTIYFDKSNNKFFLTGFKEEYSTSEAAYDVINVKLYNTNSDRPIDVSLKSNSGAQTFFNSLNQKDFNNNYVLELTYDDKSKGNINITNFPMDNQIHIPTVIREYFKITPNGLQKHNPLPSIISFEKNGQSLFKMEFDTITKQFTITNDETNTATTDGFLLDFRVDGNIIFEYDPSGNKSVVSFRPFVFDYPLNHRFQLQGSSTVPLKITNYPKLNNDFIYTKSGELIYFLITINGLKEH